MATAESSEDYARRTERIKALLSSYYGTTEGQGLAPDAAHGPPSGSAGGQHGGAQQMPSLLPGALPAIDTNLFNVDQHTNTVLRMHSLEKLMVEHRNMAREIKNLDSDMQQLVYENYNKFITATDTIRTMKHSLDGMNGELEKLQSTASIVAEKSLSVSSKLQHRRESMEQLHKVQQLLRKLQTVFDLPRKMRVALEEDALDAAVSLYAEAQPLLAKYGGSKSTFKAIAVEADFVAQEISQLLKKRLTERKDDAEQCVLLLRKLGEPDDTLQDKYLTGRLARIRRVLAEATLVAEAMATAAAGKDAPQPTKAQVESLESWSWSGVTPPPLKLFVRALDEKFINSMQETVVNVIRFFLADGSGPAKASDGSAADGAEGADQAAVRRRPLVTLARDLFAEYFSIVRRVVSDAAKAGVLRGSLLRESKAQPLELGLNSPTLQLGTDWGAEALAQALSMMSTDVGLLAGHLPELKLKEQAQDVVKAAVQQHLHLCFAALKQRVIDAAVALHAKLNAIGAPGTGAGGGPEGGTGPLLRSANTYLQELLQRGLTALLQSLRGYEAVGPRLLGPWRDAWVDLVQGGLQHFFLGVLSASLELAGLRYDGSDLMREALKTPQAGPHSSGAAGAGAELHLHVAGGAVSAQEQAKPGLVLLLAKLLKFLEQIMVPWVMETLAASFASGGTGGSDLPPSFVPGEVARRLSAASYCMVAAYCELQGRQLSLMVRRSVAATSWLAHKEPRGPRPVCDLLVERLAKVEGEVAGLLDEFPGARDDGGPGASVSSYAGPGGDAGAVERNVARLFREKVHLYGNVPLSGPAILATISSIGLKSLAECIRLQTLGRAGLQQVQLDIAYLRPAVRRYVRGGKSGAAVEQLLEEVVASASERCVEPQLLEAAVVERILSNSGAGS